MGIPMIPRESADLKGDPCTAMACVTTSGIGLKTYFRAPPATNGRGADFQDMARQVFPDAMFHS